MNNKAWKERQNASPEARRIYEEERLILWTTEAIWEAMEERGITRSDLAARLGTSRANVTQLLSGSRNMTLRSLAAIAHACELRAAIQLDEPGGELMGDVTTFISGEAATVLSFERPFLDGEVDALETAPGSSEWSFQTSELAA